MSAIEEKIRERYAAQCGAGGSLSCGTNIAYLDLAPGERVLDLGCGVGNETILVAQEVGPDGEAVGLDITPEMVRSAEQNARERQVTNVRFVTGSIERLPFADRSFDLVISNCVINHAPDKLRVFREIFRVLKKGGRLVISDAMSKEPLPDDIKKDPAQWAACFGGAVTEEEYLGAIREAGFTSIMLLNRREYLKNGYEFASLTIRAEKD